ncbi:flagellar hook-associated protein FlgL [Geobacillus sp. BCO2]|jgi:flagellar hook-associated protein 3 FlgL|nr:flagellar hook-associated protein FlgL [Geobacillus sp. BCO2]
MLSDNEDVDLEKVITDLKTQESVHRAALAVGARVIQPTLVDFLR